MCLIISLEESGGATEVVSVAVSHSLTVLLSVVGFFTAIVVGVDVFVVGDSLVVNGGGVVGRLVVGSLVVSCGSVMRGFVVSNGLVVDGSGMVGSLMVDWGVVMRDGLVVGDLVVRGRLVMDWSIMVDRGVVMRDGLVVDGSLMVVTFVVFGMCAFVVSDLVVGVRGVVVGVVGLVSKLVVALVLVVSVIRVMLTVGLMTSIRVKIALLVMVLLGVSVVGFTVISGVVVVLGGVMGLVVGGGVLTVLVVNCLVVDWLLVVVVGVSVLVMSSSGMTVLLPVVRVMLRGDVRVVMGVEVDLRVAVMGLVMVIDFPVLLGHIGGLVTVNVLVDFVRGVFGPGAFVIDMGVNWLFMMSLVVSVSRDGGEWAREK